MDNRDTTNPKWVESPKLINLVRMFWVLNIVVMLTVFVMSVGPRIAELSVACAADPCPEGSLNLRQAKDLLAANVPLEVFAWSLFLFEMGTHLVYVVMGVIIFRYHSNNILSLIVSLALISTGFFIPGTLFAALDDLPLLLQSTAYLLFAMNSPIAIIILMIFYPDGKINPAWMRIPLIILGFVILATGVIFGLSPNNGGFVASYFVVIILGVYSQSIKFRQAKQEYKQQYKWALVGVASFLLVGLASLPTFFYKSEVLASLDNTVPYIYYQLGITPLSWIFPITMAISILRYNLWNIDLVINRAVVYGAITLMIVLVFAGSLYGITSLTEEFTNSTLLAIIITATIFAVSFQPLRRNLQRFIDRNFYNIQIDYQRTPTPLHRFSAGKPDTRFGQYTELELIGRGGMAEVYRAYPDGESDPIAIKILPEDLAQDPDYRKRFEREVQVMQSLEHENIIKVIRSGEEQNLPYIVMEFVQGRDLSEHLGRVGKLDTEQTMEILNGVGSALDFAHQKGLVHRDIKPSNIMLDQQKRKARPVLMDFGIAKILGRSMMTNSGFLGTLDYISPEQIQGEEDINHQTDIYALGVMTYQMLSGKLPFPSNNPGALLLAHISQSPPDIRDHEPDLPNSVSKAIRTAMSKKPAERFDTALEFVNSLGL